MKSGNIPKTRSRQAAFTIVELIIVVIVIVILVTIVAVTYRGTTQRAANAQLLSDLDNASGQLESDYMTLKTYPASASAVDNGKGFKVSSGTTFLYKPAGNLQSYCLQATSSKAGTKIYSISSDGNAQESTCP